MDYHDSFTYKNINSASKGYIIVAFDTDNGTVDSFLGIDSVYSSNRDGSLRHNYGSKYNSVAKPTITLIKEDKTDITENEFCELARWLSGAQQVSWLDLYSGNNIAYSFLGKFNNVQQRKLDGRTIGVVATFEAVSPWAYSCLQTTTKEITDSTAIEIINLTDDLETYIYPRIVFKNNIGNYFKIHNLTLKEETSITNLSKNEIITMENNLAIYSNIEGNRFGDRFNFVWARLSPGSNNFAISGNGVLEITYRYPVKAGNCVMNL